MKQENIDRIRSLLKLNKLNTLEKEKLLINLIHYAVVRSRNDFYTYLKLMAPYLLPEKFRDGRHIKLVAGLVQKTEESVALGREGLRKKKLNKVQPIVSLPPGGMKSVTCSQLFPSWVLGRHPNWYILAVGHTEDFAIDNFGRKTKDVVETPVYKVIFPELTLREDVQAAGRWATTSKGTFVCAGAGKAIAGRRAHIAILDDVISEQTAKSDDIVKGVISWYPGGLLSRLLPDGAVIHVGTRWRPDDLIGFVEEQEDKQKKNEKKHTTFAVPALLDKRMAHFFSLKERESYWPEYWPTERYIELRDTSGMEPHQWACLYMQDPIPAEGSIIKWDWCKEWPHEDIPELDTILLSLDTAGTSKKQNDPTGYTIWGIFKRNIRGYKGEEYQSTNLILLDGGEERMDMVDLLHKIKEDWMVNYSVDIILVESAPVSLPLIDELQRRGLPVIKYRGKGDKISRMQGASPTFQQGRVWFPKRQWAKEVIGKLCKFPAGKHDDVADSTSQAVTWVMTNALVGSQEYPNNPDEWEDDDKPKATATYWSSV